MRLARKRRARNSNPKNKNRGRVVASGKTRNAAHVPSRESPGSKNPGDYRVNLSLLLDGWWRSGRSTYVGLALIAASVTATIAVTAQDAVFVVHRVGWPAIFLLTVLVVVVVARRRLFPHPSTITQVLVVVAVMVGSASWAISFWVAQSREIAAEATTEVIARASGLQASGLTIENQRFDSESLVGSKLQDAHLIDVGFVGVDLSESDLRGARLERVDLSGANLCAVDARGADLSGTKNFESVSSLQYFVYDVNTKFPEGADIDQVDGPILYGPHSRRAFPFRCGDDVTRVLTLGEVPK